MADLHHDIERYRKGELTAAEMHALEKQALRDPFLAEALEGADSVEAHQFSLDVVELQQRIASKKKKAVLIVPMRIAAGIILIAGFTFLVIKLIPAEQELALKKEESKPQPSSTPAPTVTDSVSEAKPAVSAQPVIPKKSLAHANEPKKAKEPVADREQKQEQMALSESSTMSSGVSAAEPAIAQDVKADVVEEVMENEKVAEAPAPSLAAKDARALRAKIKKTAPSMSAPENKNIRLTGVVTDTDGSPIPGVNVVIKGTERGAVTDVNGRYELPLWGGWPDLDMGLEFSFIGYQTKVVAVDKAENNVQLAIDVSQLSEVVVTGYGVKRDADDSEPVMRLAEPFGGRKAYDKYLDDNLRYPAEALTYKIKGKVAVEFTVKTDGSLAEFNVVKSLGHGCDEEVLRLVKEGPRWYPTTRDNVPIESTVRVKMKFDPAKAGRK